MANLPGAMASLCWSGITSTCTRTRTNIKSVELIVRGQVFACPFLSILQSSKSFNPTRMKRPKLTQHEAESLIDKFHLQEPVKLLGIRGYYKRTMGNPLKNDRGIYDD